MSNTPEEASPSYPPPALTVTRSNAFTAEEEHLGMEAEGTHSSRHPRHPSTLYHGHRRASFRDDDLDELVELRARQRTFDGAYIRTALGNYGYALLILKVFSAEFARIGLLYVILATLLLLLSLKRKRRSDHDFADQYKTSLPPRAEDGSRIWGRPFQTSGEVVLTIGVATAGLIVALFVSVMRLTG
ncbi:hypothetical protein T439DRAFT_327041 [Meredithblackwellia eburnea MCA 4105]